MKISQLAPRDPQVLLAPYQLARQTMDQALMNLLVAAPESAQMHIVMADEQARKGNRIRAVEQYRQALKLNPALPGAHLLLAEQLRTSPDPKMNSQAEAEYRAAVALNPYCNSSINNRSDRTEYKPCNKSALSSFSGAIDGRPSLEYMASKRGDSSFSASSVISRIARSGCWAGTRSSGET